MNLMMLLEMAAQGMGDREALVSGDSRLSYAQLFAAAKGAAAQITGSGAQHAGLLDISSPAMPITLFASSWAVAVPRAARGFPPPPPLLPDFALALRFVAGAGRRLVFRTVFFLRVLGALRPLASFFGPNAKDS